MNYDNFNGMAALDMEVITKLDRDQCYVLTAQLRPLFDAFARPLIYALFQREAVISTDSLIDSSCYCWSVSAPLWRPPFSEEICAFKKIVHEAEPTLALIHTYG